MPSVFCGSADKNISGASKPEDAVPHSGGLKFDQLKKQCQADGKSDHPPSIYSHYLKIHFKLGKNFLPIIYDSLPFLFRVL